jgi:hypothetical protein
VNSIELGAKGIGKENRLFISVALSSLPYDFAFLNFFNNISMIL